MTRNASSLSVIVITLNEAENIGACLASVRGLASEIIVVDSCSTDGTQAICLEYGARVVETEDWPGFGLQKQRALDLAEGPWILSIDADETVSQQLADEIRATIAHAAHAGYRLPRRSQFLGHWVRHCGWYPDYVLRLFRKDAARFSPDLVHERVELSGAAGTLRSPLMHYSYRTAQQVTDKVERYAHAGALEARLKGKKAGTLTASIKGCWAFLRTWILRLGLLDGRTGWRIAAMNARCTYRKYALLRTLSKAQKNRPT